MAIQKYLHATLYAKLYIILSFIRKKVSFFNFSSLASSSSTSLPKQTFSPPLNQNSSLYHQHPHLRHQYPPQTHYNCHHQPRSSTVILTTTNRKPPTHTQLFVNEMLVDCWLTKIVSPNSQPIKESTPNLFLFHLSKVVLMVCVTVWSHLKSNQLSKFF